MIDDRLTCVIGSGQLTRGSKYKIIKEKQGWVKIQLDNGVYRWIKRDRFLSVEELERCRR